MKYSPAKADPCIKCNLPSDKLSILYRVTPVIKAISWSYGQAIVLCLIEEQQRYRNPQDKAGIQLPYAHFLCELMKVIKQTIRKLAYYLWLNRYWFSSYVTDTQIDAQVWVTSHSFVIWKRLPNCWPFVKDIHPSSVNFTHKWLVIRSFMPVCLPE